MSELNIYQRINKVRKEIQYIKRGSAGQGTGVMYDEVVALARDLIVDNGIMITTDFISDSYRITEPKKNYIYEAFIRVHYVNMDKPEDRFHTDIVAHAMDAGDKAPGKAVTYATKASLLKVLFLETGINDESRAEQQASHSTDQYQLFQDLITDECDFSLFCFIKSISEDVYISLYNSFPKGKKVSMKESCDVLVKDGALMASEIIVNLDEYSDREDIAITQLVEGLGDTEKRYLAGKMKKSTLEFLSKCKKEQE